MEISTKYSPKEIEDKWYKYWLDNGYFKSVPNNKKAYTIVIPPPNVTGVLHMGHMMNNTIQDLLIRRARMLGYNACWVPGTDHASIATEAKVVAKLKDEGIQKSDITREEFLKHAWDWTHKHGGIILKQLKKLGASCDWDRTKFTMDEDLSTSVTKVFVELYNKGLIYRGYRMVNWDPEALTTVSDEEVVYVEKQAKLYYLKYKIENTDEYIVVATTRPETIFGDTAVCINPDDKRYSHLKGKKVIVPIANKAVPIIFDNYVDEQFGTGCLKVTPAHDQNDKTLGEKHNLEVIDIFTDDAKLNDFGMHYKGLDRFVVRKMIEKELAEKNMLEKVENYTNKVSTSERTGAVIEPKTSLQWFLKMDELAKPALEAVENGQVKLIPEKFKNTYRHWMTNIHQWSISRQLWWGHQIPAWYYGEGVNDFVVAENLQEAQKLAGDKKLIKQDPDALDTWFSSWLWPISVFDGINNPDNAEFKYYYPTNDLVTAPEILFFWVARMIMAGYSFTGEKPFSNVYLTGIVRDKLGRKMSKSLGNSPDPIELIETYGADAVRLGMLLTAPAGNDFPFDTELCKQGAGFCNKIWNAYRLLRGFEVDEKMQQSNINQTASKWIKNKINQQISEIEKLYSEFKLSEALMTIYKLTWDDFCASYLEMIKPPYGEKIDAQTYKEAITFFETLLKLLHPIMPFITEELWQNIAERTKEEALIITEAPKAEGFDENLLKQIDFVLSFIASLRMLRQEKSLSPKETLEVFSKEMFPYKELAEKLANCQIICEDKVENSISFIVEKSEFFITLKSNINKEEEISKLEKELEYFQGFLQSVEKKLGNERFMQSAPENVRQNELNKQKDALSKIEIIKKTISDLKN